MNGDLYRVVVTSGAGVSVSSQDALLVVNKLSGPPQILAQPTDQAVTSPASATFSVQANGDALAYRWEYSRDQGLSWALEPSSQTGSSFTTGPTESPMNGWRYRVTVSNSFGSVVSEVAGLTVVPGAGSPLFTVHPQSVTVSAPATATFVANASGLDVRYQWYRAVSDSNQDLLPIPGATGPTLSIGPTNLGDNGVWFRVKASNAVGGTLSNAARLTVNPTPVPPFIEQQPLNVAVPSGAAAVFDVTVKGTPDPFLQWQQSSDGGTSFSDIPGALGPVLRILNVTNALHGHRVRVRALSEAGVTTSSVAVLRVLPSSLLPSVDLLAGNVGGEGNADGRGPAARFNLPQGVTVAPDGSVFIADRLNHTIRRISPVGDVTTFAGQPGRRGYADGAAANAMFNTPIGITSDSAGNLYVADTQNDAIRRVTPDGFVSTVSRRDDAVPLRLPSGVAMDARGTIYVVDGAHTVRKLRADGTPTVLAGVPTVWGARDGQGSQAYFDDPFGITVAANGDLIVAEARGRTIRRVTPAGFVTTIAGAWRSFGSVDGPAAQARFGAPLGVAVDAQGAIYVLDGNHSIRKISVDGIVSTFAGISGMPGEADGAPQQARFRDPAGIAIGPAGVLYVSDGSNTVRRVTSSGTVATLAGMPSRSGMSDGSGGSARFRTPAGLAADGQGNVFVTDIDAHTIRRIDVTGNVTTLAGLAGQFGSADGTGAEARFHLPQGLSYSSYDNMLYVADTGNSRIRKINAAGAVSTVAGNLGGYQDGPVSVANFLFPVGVLHQSNGDFIVADTANSRLRRVLATGSVVTLSAGPPGAIDGPLAQASFDFPEGLVQAADGSVYIADMSNHTIRKVAPDGTVSTVAGVAGRPGYSDGMGSQARFAWPRAITIDAAGVLYVADQGNYVVRRVAPDGTVTTVLGSVGVAGATGVDPARLGRNLRGVAVLPGKRLAVSSENGILVAPLP